MLLWLFIIIFVLPPSVTKNVRVEVEASEQGGGGGGGKNNMLILVWGGGGADNTYPHQLG